MFTCSLVSPYLQEKKNEERGKGSLGVSRATDEEEEEDEEEEVEEEGLAFLRFVNSRDDKNMSPLHLASFKGHNEVSEDKPKELPSPSPSFIIIKFFFHLPVPFSSTAIRFNCLLIARALAAPWLVICLEGDRSAPGGGCQAAGRRRGAGERRRPHRSSVGGARRTAHGR